MNFANKSIEDAIEEVIVGQREALKVVVKFAKEQSDLVEAQEKEIEELNQLVREMEKELKDWTDNYT